MYLCEVLLNGPRGTGPFMSQLSKPRLPTLDNGVTARGFALCLGNQSLDCVKAWAVRMSSKSWMRTGFQVGLVLRTVTWMVSPIFSWPQKTSSPPNGPSSN